MSDNSGKRAPRTFEPPPWERDAFEELARKREAEEATARETAEARAQLQVAEALKAQAAAAAKVGDEDPVVARARLLAATELAKEQDAATAPVTTQDGGTGGGVEAATPADESITPVAPGIDDRKVAEMLAVLSVQEPKAKSSGIFGLVAGILLAVLGVGMIVLSVWWQATGPKAGAAPAQLLIQSTLVGGFGLGFTVLGGLIGYQSRLQARS